MLSSDISLHVDGQPSEIEMESQVHLYGHTEEVTSLFVCKPYSILISVSRDGTCVIWDLNRYRGSRARTAANGASSH